MVRVCVKSGVGSVKNKVKRLLAAVTFLCAWLTLLSASCFAAAAMMPAPTSDIYLVDDANMVEEADRQQILSIGADLDRATKAQIVVVTTETLGDESLEDYSNRLFRAWGIGDRKKNNGVLLFIAKQDRKFRIEVGYGLEGAITDGYAGSVLDGMKADFRKGKYSPAILAAYGKLVQKAYEAEGAAAPENVGAAAGATGGAVPGASGGDTANAAANDDEDWTWWEMLLGVPIALVLVGLLLWCLWQMVYLVFMLFAMLLFLLTSGMIDLTDFFGGFGGGGGGGGSSGGGWSGGGGGGSSGGGFGGGSSGGGGSSSGW